MVESDHKKSEASLTPLSALSQSPLNSAERYPASDIEPEPMEFTEIQEEPKKKKVKRRATPEETGGFGGTKGKVEKLTND